MEVTRRHKQVRRRQKIDAVVESNSYRDLLKQATCYDMYMIRPAAGAFLEPIAERGLKIAAIACRELNLPKT
jgi:hypothetical protein